MAARAAKMIGRPNGGGVLAHVGILLVLDGRRSVVEIRGLSAQGEKFRKRCDEARYQYASNDPLGKFQVGPPKIRIRDLNILS